VSTNTSTANDVVVLKRQLAEIREAIASAKNISTEEESISAEDIKSLNDQAYCSQKG